MTAAERDEKMRELDARAVRRGAVGAFAAAADYFKNVTLYPLPSQGIPIAPCRRERNITQRKSQLTEDVCRAGGTPPSL